MLQNPVKWNSSIKNLKKKRLKGIRSKDQNFEREKNMTVLGMQCWDCHKKIIIVTAVKIIYIFF